MKDVPIWEKSNLTLEEAAASSSVKLLFSQIGTSFIGIFLSL